MRDQHDRRARLLVDLAEQQQDLALDGHVESGRRLVGDDELRLPHQARRDHGALAHAPGEFVRVLADANLGACDLHIAQPGRRKLHRERPAHSAVHLGHLSELTANPQCGIQRIRRILEYQGHGGAEQAAQLGSRRPAQVTAQVVQSSPGGLPRIGQQLGEGKDGHALAASRFPDDADPLARADIEGEVTDGCDHPAGGPEENRQPGHLQDRSGRRRGAVDAGGRRGRSGCRGRRGRTKRARRREALPGRHRAEAGQRLSGQVEGQACQDDKCSGPERGQRVLVDVLQARTEQRSPVIRRRAHPEAKEAQSGYSQQGPADGHRGRQD